MAKRWAKAEVTYLKRYGAKMTTLDLAERFSTEPAVVQAKLEELGLVDHSVQADQAVGTFERGLKAIHRQKWEEASRLFAKTLEETDQTDLANRARRYLEMARERIDGDAGYDDPFLEAVYERNQGDLDAALAICSRGGRQSKDERFAYLAAAIHSLKGDLPESVRFLELACELNPKNRVHAENDADFAALQSDADYAQIFVAE